MIKIPFTECVKLVGGAPKKYIGEKIYVSTGAVNCNEIDQTQIEAVSYDNKPSRANLVAEEGDILFAKMQNTHKVLLINEHLKEHVYSTGFCAVRAKEQILSNECLFYLLNSPQFLSQKDKYCSGATQKAITNEALSKLTVSIPEAGEQANVVGSLDKISALIEKRKRQIEKLDLLVNSKFIEMFSGVEKEDALMNLCNFIDYRGKTPQKAEEGLPFITAKNIRMHYMSFDTQEFISKEIYKKVMTRGFPKEGDVVFTTEAPLGNVCRIPHMDTEFYIGQRIITMQTTVLEPAYLEYALASESFRRKIAEKSSGSTVTGIRSKLLEKLTVPVPDKEQQKLFARFTEQTEKSKLIIKQSLEKLQTLKKALMQKYFG